MEMEMRLTGVTVVGRIEDEKREKSKKWVRREEKGK
jgi:hypothetical protein